MTKPEFTDADLARWKEALSNGSALRFDDGKGTLVIHTLGELETFLQLDPGTLTPTSLEGNSENETIRSLFPGVAVFSLNGPYNDGDGEPNAQWSLPGDFQRYLQPGEPDTRASGLVREILVGSYRNLADDDNDDPAYLGTFIPESEWDAVVGLQSKIRELEGQLAAPATAPASSALPVPSALPDNALELIQTAGSLSKPKAEAVLAALQASTTEAAPQ